MAKGRKVQGGRILSQGTVLLLIPSFNPALDEQDDVRRNQRTSLLTGPSVRSISVMEGGVHWYFNGLGKVGKRAEISK